MLWVSCLRIQFKTSENSHGLNLKIKHQKNSCLLCKSLMQQLQLLVGLTSASIMLFSSLSNLHIHLYIRFLISVLPVGAFLLINDFHYKSCHTEHPHSVIVSNCKHLCTLLLLYQRWGATDISEPLSTFEIHMCRKISVLLSAWFLIFYESSINGDQHIWPNCTTFPGNTKFLKCSHLIAHSLNSPEQPYFNQAEYGAKNL